MKAILPYPFGTEVFEIGLKDTNWVRCPICRGMGEVSGEDDYGGHVSRKCYNGCDKGWVRGSAGDKPVFRWTIVNYGKVCEYVISQKALVINQRTSIFGKFNGEAINPGKDCFDSRDKALKACEARNGKLIRDESKEKAAKKPSVVTNPYLEV